MAETSQIDENDPNAGGKPTDAPEESGVEATNDAASAEGGADSGGDEAPTLESLAVALAAAEQKIEDQKDAVLRAHAESENVRRRAQRDVEHAHKFGLEKFVNELLPVRDSLEAGLQAAGGGDEAAQVREGMELTLKMFDAATAKFGLEVLDPSGEKFDPEFHEAMTMVDGGEAASGSVVTVVQKGFRLNERLVRPARVLVAK